LTFHWLAVDNRRYDHADQTEHGIKRCAGIARAEQRRQVSIIAREGLFLKKHLIQYTLPGPKLLLYIHFYQLNRDRFSVSAAQLQCANSLGDIT
jgi:hypothetical protein